MALWSSDCERGSNYGPVPLQPPPPRWRRRRPCGAALSWPYRELLRVVLATIAVILAAVAVACLLAASLHLSGGWTSPTGRRCAVGPCKSGRPADLEVGSVPIFLNHRLRAGAAGKGAARDAISLVGSGGPVNSTAEKDNGVPVLVGQSDWTSDTVCKWVLGLPRDISVEKVREVASYWKDHGVSLLYVGESGVEGLAILVVQTTLGNIRKILERYPELQSKPQYVERAPPLHIEPDPSNRMPAPQATSSVQQGTKQVFPPSWGLDRIDQRVLPLDDMYDPQETPESTGDVHVYILDTGIRTTHSEFEGRAIPTLESVDVLKECSEEDTTCADDKNGHGTHVAATVGGRTCGVAKGATLHAVKTLKDDGLGDWASIAMAINWVLVHGARPAILQMSISGPGEVGFIAAALESAVDSGVAVVVAAGNNDGQDACDFTPSISPEAIRVGAIQEDNKRASYSNIGDCVDLFAPGTLIVSASNMDDVSLTEKNGTSMATPHVTGAAALLLAKNPALTPAGIRARLVEDATSGVVRDVGAKSPNLLLCTGLCRADASPPTSRLGEPAGAAEQSLECGQGWSVSAGPCSMDVECCVRSPSYPEPYGSEESCLIAVGPSPGPINVMVFSTEFGFDKLTINGQEYHGLQKPPEGLVPSGEIVWSSDDSREARGWKLCMPERGSAGGRGVAASPAAPLFRSGGTEDAASTPTLSPGGLFGLAARPQPHGEVEGPNTASTPTL